MPLPPRSLALPLFLDRSLNRSIVAQSGGFDGKVRLKVLLNIPRIRPYLRCSVFATQTRPPIVHCRGKFRSVPVSPSLEVPPRTPLPPPRITVTTRNTAPTPFCGLSPSLTSLPLAANFYFGSFSTSRHRHRLQQTESSAPAQPPQQLLHTPPCLPAGAPPAASCVSPPRRRPRLPLLAWVHFI